MTLVTILGEQVGVFTPHTILDDTQCCMSLRVKEGNQEESFSKHFKFSEEALKPLTFGPR